MAVDTKANLVTRSQTVKTENVFRANTASRIGSLFEDLADSYLHSTDSDQAVKDAAARDRVSADIGDAAVALSATSPTIQRFASPLTASRNVTLPAAGLFNGLAFLVVREPSATGFFDVNVGPGLARLHEPGEWVLVYRDGSAWRYIRGRTEQSGIETLSGWSQQAEVEHHIHRASRTCPESVATTLLTIPTDRWRNGANRAEGVFDIKVLAMIGSNGIDGAWSVDVVLGRDTIDAEIGTPFQKLNTLNGTVALVQNGFGVEVQVTPNASFGGFHYGRAEGDVINN